MCDRVGKRVGLAAILALLLCSCDRNKESTRTEPSRGPSVLVITLDTTRADRIGCYGHAAAQTPSIDALANSGVLFRRAYCQVPLTLPSHSSMMTGTYPPTNGVPVNGVALGKGIATLAETFRGEGYRTGAFISALVLDSGYGLDRGFDEYNDDLGSTSAIERKANRTTDAALEWLARDADEPFFAWVHYFDAHYPYAPPSAFRESFDDPYDGEIAFVDTQVDRLVKWLDATGRRDNTLVIIAGDHGESFGEHKETEHGFFIYDATMHVSLIFSFPGHASGETAVDTPVGLIDVFPTIVDLLGWKEHSDLEGISLAPIWRGETDAHAPVYGESEYPHLGFGWAPLHSITTAHWRYIDAPRGELFDRTADPLEQRNVIEQHPSVASDLHEQLMAMREKMHPRSQSVSASSANALNNLEALGYVGGAASAVDSDNTGPKRDPKNMVGAFEAHSRAVGALLGERYAEVIELVRPLVQQSPESDEFYNTLGRALLESGRYAEAQHAFEMSLRRTQSNPRRLRRLGESLLRQKKFADAIAAFKEAIAISPEFAEAHSSLGDAFAGIGQPDDALRHYRAAVAASPDLARACGRLGVALARKKQFEAALVHLRHYAELEPNSPHALTNLGNVLFQTRKLGDAAKLFRKALKIDPRYASAHMSLFQVLLLSGKTREGIQALRAAKKAIPRSIDLTRRLAWLLATTTIDDLRSPEEALQLAQQVVNARTPTADDLATLAAAFAAGGDFDTAIQHATQALSLATARQNARASQRIQRHLQHYQSATPYRE
jgi:arylsulfatase A-like enzyme/tetratricopeptide (TPR) repeat protein